MCKQIRNYIINKSGVCVGIFKIRELRPGCILEPNPAFWECPALAGFYPRQSLS
jgi:hypothetical protein